MEKRPGLDEAQSRMKTCKDCKFHVKHDETIGFCYRYPPTSVSAEQSATPPVKSDATWCGEFKGKGWFK